MDYAAMVDSLVEFYSAEEIRAFWKQAADALMARQTVNLHINATGQESRSASSIELTTPEQQGAFIRCCQAAIRQLEGTTSIPANQLGVSVDFRYREVQT